jgi:hypothetical protein
MLSVASVHGLLEPCLFSPVAKQNITAGAKLSSSTLVIFHFAFVCLAVVGFDLMASCLLGGHFTS